MSSQIQNDSLNRRAVLVMLTSGIASLSTGCGGRSGTRSPVGEALFTVRWTDADSRIIPVGTKSIEIVVSPQTGAVRRGLASRSGDEAITVIRIASIPSGDATAVATAYSLPDAKGNVLARGSAMVRVSPNATVNAVIQMSASGVSPTPGPNPTSDTTPPEGAVDSPYLKSCQTIIGASRLAGWAIDPGFGGGGIASIRLLLDGSEIPDIVFPDPDNNPRISDGNTGFYLDWDSGAVGTGFHSLDLSLSDRSGNVNTAVFGKTKGIFNVSRDWSLIRAQGESTVFLSYQGERRAFNSPECLIDWGLQFSNVRNVSRQEIEAHRWANPVPHLLTTDGTEIWYVQDGNGTSNGYRRPISGWDTFVGMGFTREDVRAVVAAQMNKYTQGRPLTSVEPRLIITRGPYITGDLHVGRQVRAEFTVRNLTLRRVRVQDLLLSVPDGPNASPGIYDFPYSGSFDLDPGGEYTYSASRSFSNPGTYGFNCAFRINDNEYHQAMPSGIDTDRATNFEVRT